MGWNQCTRLSLTLWNILPLGVCVTSLKHLQCMARKNIYLNRAKSEIQVDILIMEGTQCSVRHKVSV